MVATITHSHALRDTKREARNRYGLPRVPQWRESAMRQVEPGVLPVTAAPLLPSAARVETARDHAGANGNWATGNWATGLAPLRFPDCQANQRLWDDEHAVRVAFNGIVPALKEIAALQHEHDFVPRAQEIAQRQLGFPLPEALLQDAWVETLDMRSLYAHTLCHTYRRLLEREVREQDGVEEALRGFLECGFHSVDVSPCADGRLQGLVKYILRLPARAVHREAYAGALFDIEESVRSWAATELRRHREGVPNLSDAATQYLKIAVYHWSSSDRHQGCAAHGSDVRIAAEAALARLTAFRQAIENSYCCGASVATLLIGVDTDNDAIKVHLPDGKGEMSEYRYVDNRAVYQQIVQGAAPRAAVRAAVEQALAAQGWGMAEGRPADGMLRFVTRLLENNLKQQDYVDNYYQGRYPDIGHQERFISVGNGHAGVQLRNLAYYAHMDTLEEGAADLDVGVKIFKKLNVEHGLPVPVILQLCYSQAVPGARERALQRAQRLGEAIRQRYAELVQTRLLSVFTSLQDKDSGVIEFITVPDEPGHERSKA